MNTKTTRLLKEARPLLLPWCAVMIAGALPLVNRLDFTVSISMIGFWAGIPLLATLSLGDEFQYRTLPLLLAQPVGRMEIWREKLSVTVVAVLSTALVFFLVWRVVPLEFEPQDLPFLGAWTLGIFASATFWTLFTRSTLGGVVLNFGIQTFIVISTWNHVEDRVPGKGALSPANATLVSILAFVFLCYAGAMLWLGGRKLARFQVTGGMAGDDLLMAGPDVMPRALAVWFRCRPTGAVLNLIRKELRLLRPLWLLTLLAAVGWALLTVQRWTIYGITAFVPSSGSTKNVPVAVFIATVVGVFSTLILAVLAGSLSLGEERTSGTHAWHMTLPVSARRQWLIKLLMALFAGFVSAVLIPGLVLIACGYFFGSPFMFVNMRAGIAWLLIVLLLSFASFWCACAINGTVRAALWVFPTLFALAMAGQFGGWTAEKLMPLIVSKFDFFSGIRFINSVSKLPFSYFLGISSSTIYFNHLSPGSAFYLLATLVLGPILVFGVLQSYRLFKAQVPDGVVSIIRNLLPLATLVLLCSFSLAAYNALVEHSMGQIFGMFMSLREAHLAIEKIHPSVSNLDAAHPLQLTVDDLVKAYPLSKSTRNWLRGSTISLAPDKAHTRECCRIWNSEPFHPYGGQLSYPLYIATIHLARGSKCPLFPYEGNFVLGASKCTLFFYGGAFSVYADGVCE